MTKRSVVLLFFDLPMKEKEDAKKYRKFKKALKKNGFIFLQESVYMKLVRSGSICADDLKMLQNSIPEDSTVMLLPLALDAFTKISVLSGSGIDFEAFAADYVYL